MTDQPRNPAPSGKPAPRRRRRADALADPSSTTTPSAGPVAVPPASEAPLSGDQVNAAILRLLRRYPNQTVELTPLADELGISPWTLQLAVEHLGRRRMVVVPFIEPGQAGGATLTEKGLRWLIDREGGSPADKPAAFKVAKKRVRAEDEAARLPRAQVYGGRTVVSRG